MIVHHSQLITSVSYDKNFANGVVLKELYLKTSLAIVKVKSLIHIIGENHMD